MSALSQSFAGLETPCVLVDLSVVRNNIAVAMQIAQSGGVALRPHAKTHKCGKIAELQIAAGASGVTVATVEEALYFLSIPCNSVTWAIPQTRSDVIARVLNAAGEAGKEINLVVDSAHSLEAVSEASSNTGKIANVLLKVDVGLHRCGVDPEAPGAVEVAKRLAVDKRLRFRGLLSHAGHAYGANGPAEIRRIAADEIGILAAFSGKLERAGIACPVISIGSTPTLYANAGFEGVSEIRPGNFVYCDLTQVELGLVTRADIALSVLATVISVNDRYAITDAGSKTLSSDRGPHGVDKLSHYGVATRIDNPGQDFPVMKLSEEHGFIDHRGQVMRIGERVRIWPNHSCVVSNLAANFKILEQGQLIDQWPVGARRQNC